VYKVVWTVRFAAGTDVDEGRRRWAGEHAELARAVPGIERYVQSHATASLGLVGIEASRAASDGYGCMWFADRSGFLDARDTPEWAALAADAGMLFDIESMASLNAAIEERTIIEGPSGPFKAVWFVRFKDEIRADPARTREAHDYWTGTHGGAYGVNVPGIDRYVQNHVIGRLDEADHLGFDGFSECWFQDSDAFDLTMSSSEWGEMNEDALNLFDRDWIVGGMSALIEEKLVVG
jgi:EthD domain